MSEFIIKKKGGTLQFFSKWFGRPYDNLHTIQSSQYEDSMLIIHFKEGECLTITHPDEMINEREHFEIKSATSVLWEYPDYGSDQKNKNYIKYTVTEDQIVEDKNGRTNVYDRENISAIVMH